MLLGQTSTPLYHWLIFGHTVLLHNLSKDPDAKVSIPNNYELKFYREAIWAEKPICENVWAAADGLKLLIQESTTDSKQN